MVKFQNNYQWLMACQVKILNHRNEPVVLNDTAFQVKFRGVV